MIAMIILAVIKIIDNILMTAKTFAIYQNKKIISAFLVILNQFVFYLIIKQVMEDDSLLSTFVVCISSGIGTYVAFLINNKMKRDESWMNVLTCRQSESTSDLYYYLVNHNIKSICMNTIGPDSEQTKTVMAFAKTKYESSLIDEYLKNSPVDYMRQIRR